MTVMIPSYNYERYLVECVESAATQVGVDVEVVIVDNGSTDNSVEVARGLAERFDNVRLVVNADNQGIITSFNRCRAHVRGEFATLLCADDGLAPGSLARAVALMNDHPSVGLVYGPAVDFTDISDVDTRRFEIPAGTPIVYPGSEWIERRARSGTNTIRTPEAMMRTSVIEQVGLLDPSCPFTSDLNMWLRIAALSDVAYLPGPAQALFRRHSGSFGQTYVGPGQSRFDIEQRWQAFDRFFDTLGDRPERADWEALARSTLASEARYVATRAFLRPPSEVPDGEIAKLGEFAERLDPEPAPRLEALGWRVRRAIGPKASRFFPVFLVRPTLRRLNREWAERRRVRRGV